MTVQHEPNNIKFFKSKLIISATLASSLLISGFNATPSTAETLSDTPTQNVYSAELSELEDVLTFIEDMPDEAFESDEQYYKYLNDSLPSKSIKPLGGATPQGLTIGDEVTSLGCLGAVGVAVIGSFPPAKIFKIRSVIKTAGGAKTFVEKVKKHSKDAKDRGVVGKANMEYSLKNASGDAWPEVQDALLDFFGLAGVAHNCGISWE